MKLENEISNLANEVKKLTSAVQDMSKKVQEVLEIKEQSSEISFKCDLCSYSTHSSKGLKCHVSKKHKVEIVRETFDENSLELSFNHDARYMSYFDNSSSDSDDDASELEMKEKDEEVNKTDCIMECFEDVLVNHITLEYLQERKKCDMCDYENANLAYLVIHMAKVHYNPNCQCCDSETWLKTSSWVHKLWKTGSTWKWYKWNCITEDEMK